jgi:hypothetical protein
MTFLIHRTGGFNSPASLFGMRLIRAGWVVVRRGDGFAQKHPDLPQAYLPDHQI